MKPAAFAFGIFLLSASTQATEVAELAWLTGHWRHTRNGRISEETWSAPAGGMLLGTKSRRAREWLGLVRVPADWEVEGDLGLLCEPGRGDRPRRSHSSVPSRMR